MKYEFSLFWKPIDNNLLRYALQYGMTPENILRSELFHAWSIFQGEINEIILTLIKNNLNVFFPTAQVEQHGISSRTDT